MEELKVNLNIQLCSRVINVVAMRRLIAGTLMRINYIWCEAQCFQCVRNVSPLGRYQTRLVILYFIKCDHISDHSGLCQVTKTHTAN